MLNNNFFSQPNDGSESPDPLQQDLPGVIPIVEEFISVEKSWVETGKITITKKVEEETENVNVSLLSDEYSIEHVSINRYVDDAIPKTRQEGDTMILPVLKEVMVKRVLLVEEIKITKTTTENQEQHNVLLRKESVDIKRSAPNLP